jgi:DNA-binding winged helix-turn-helix (wHTH) protein
LSNGHVTDNGHSTRFVQFGNFELDRETGELRKHGLKVRLQGKPFQILQALLEQPGEVVTREQLRRRLWAADTFVDFESGLNTAANRLRITLGDSADHPRFVETLARSGYRFIAPVSVIAPTTEEVPVAPASLPSVGEDVPEPRAKRDTRLLWALTAAFIAGVLLAGTWGWFRSAPQPASFEQVTFRRGYLGFARFGPDSQSVIYSGRFGDDTKRLYMANLNSPESRGLDISNASLAGVSSTGELALLVFDPNAPSFGARLARVALNGGSPMPIAEHVVLADWLPDGNSLAIVRSGPRGASIEFPIGKEIYRTNGWIDSFRVSPAGDAVALMEHPLMGDDAGQVKAFDRNGKVIMTSSGWGSAAGLAWPPSGKEVLFTAARTGAMRELWAVTRSGALRRVASVPTSLRIFDIAPDGRVLIARDTQRRSMLRVSGSETESDISWFDWSRPQDMSRNGNQILFDETGQGGGTRYMVYLRDEGKNATTRLGEGSAQSLSPDGRWALTLGARERTFLTLVPLAAPGQPRRISGQGIEYQWARFFPQGGRILCAGAPPGQQLRLYVQDIDGGKPVPLPFDTYLEMPSISPDGRQLAGLNANARVEIVNLGGGSTVLQTPPWTRPVRWTRDGKTLIVATWRGVPSKLFRVNLTTGASTFWKTVGPSDRAGATATQNVLIADDDQTIVYDSITMLSELFVAHGWT